MATKEDESKFKDISIKFLHKISDIIKSQSLQAAYKLEIAQMKGQRTLDKANCSKCFLNFQDSQSSFKIVPHKNFKFLKKCLEKRSKKKRLTKYQHLYLQKSLKNHSDCQKMKVTCGFCTNKVKKYFQNLPGKTKNTKVHKKAQEINNDISELNVQRKKKKKNSIAGLRPEAIASTHRELQSLLGQCSELQSNDSIIDVDAPHIDVDAPHKEKENLKQKKLNGAIVPPTYVHSHIQYPTVFQIKPLQQKKGQTTLSNGQKKKNNNVIEMKKQAELLAIQKNKLSSLASKKEKKKLKHKLNTLVNDIKNAEVNSKSKKSHFKQFLESIK